MKFVSWVSFGSITNNPVVLLQLFLKFCERQGTFEKALSALEIIQKALPFLEHSSVAVSQGFLRHSSLSRDG